MPTQLKVTISSTNAWGFDYLAVTVRNGETYVLNCLGVQTSAGITSRNWVDGDGTVTALTFDIVGQTC